MFCNACGKEIQPGHVYCSSCGKPVVAPVAVLAPNRLEQHRRLLGILWLVYALFTLLGGVALVVVANVIFGHMRVWHESAPNFVHPLLMFIGLLILVKGILSLVAAWGLLERLQWARMLAVVLGMISLFNIPFGTALGIYTLWVLMSRDAEQQYAASAG